MQRFSQFAHGSTQEDPVIIDENEGLTAMAQVRDLDPAEESDKESWNYNSDSQSEKSGEEDLVPLEQAQEEEDEDPLLEPLPPVPIPQDQVTQPDPETEILNHVPLNDGEQDWDHDQESDDTISTSSNESMGEDATATSFHIISKYLDHPSPPTDQATEWLIYKHAPPAPTTWQRYKQANSNVKWDTTIDNAGRLVYFVKKGDDGGSSSEEDEKHINTQRATQKGDSHSQESKKVKMTTPKSSASPKLSSSTTPRKSQLSVQSHASSSGSPPPVAAMRPSIATSINTPRSSVRFPSQISVASDALRAMQVKKQQAPESSYSKRSICFCTLLSFEVITNCPPKRIEPLPDEDTILAVVYCLRDERARSLLPDKDYQDGLGAIVIGEANENGINWASMSNSFDMTYVSDEKRLIIATVELIQKFDPTIIMGYDIRRGSLGYLIERALYLKFDNIMRDLGRWITEGGIQIPEDSEDDAMSENSQQSQPQASPNEQNGNNNNVKQAAHVRDPVGPALMAGGIQLVGRILCNVWRMLRSEVKLQHSSIQCAAKTILDLTIPTIEVGTLAIWFNDPKRRHLALRHVSFNCKLNFELLDSLEVLSRGVEMALLYGMDFWSVCSRGSQFRVESVLIRACRQMDFLCLSPTRQEVADMEAIECIPLVMEPKSSFYWDPVIVLDFQSLYPSIVIAYNFCMSTGLGRLANPINRPYKKYGCGNLDLPPKAFLEVGRNDGILATDNDCMFTKKHIRHGIIPLVLEEVLRTRIMVKKALKQQKELNAPVDVIRQLNARQFGLKMLANVTYGYTAASHSGRMPCTEVADAIVQTARRALERAIDLVERSGKFGEGIRVVYGDTDSLFVLCPDRNLKQAFEIGSEIAKAVTAQNPAPMELQMDKVYYPCTLVAKKRYVGLAYSSPDGVPVFDAKGVETVRRDQCNATTKIMRGALETIYKTKSLAAAREFTIRQFIKIFSQRSSIQDYIFFREVRPQGKYRAAQLPPAAQVAAMQVQTRQRRWPSAGQRVPYVIGYKADRLVQERDIITFVDNAMPPEWVIGHQIEGVEPPPRNIKWYLHATYYITKQVVPAMTRLFELLKPPIGPAHGRGVDIMEWAEACPKLRAHNIALEAVNAPKHTLNRFYQRADCILCGEKTNAAKFDLFCTKCLKSKNESIAELLRRYGHAQMSVSNIQMLCLNCTGSSEAANNCHSAFHCSAYFEKRKMIDRADDAKAIVDRLWQQEGAPPDHWE